jgi:hypothetical protein
MYLYTVIFLPILYFIMLAIKTTENKTITLNNLKKWKFLYIYIKLLPIYE